MVRPSGNLLSGLLVWGGHLVVDASVLEGKTPPSGGGGMDD